jgi:hypothetical protein
MRRLAAALPLLPPTLVVGAYAALLPAGKWQGDEYLAAWFVAQDGWHFLLDRLIGRSPRPVAEILTWLYLTVSNALDRSLGAYLLAALWLSALAGIALAGRVAPVRRPLHLALVLFAFALLLIKPSEMFYWPMGAVAYVPCWAALAAATVLHRGQPDRRHNAALTLALIVAVLSAEVGAITMLFYAALVGLASLRDHPLHRLRPIIVPALGGVAVCLIVLRGRMQAGGEVMDASSGLAGNWPASLWAALPSFGREAIGIAGLPLLAGAAIKLLLLLCLPPDGRRSPQGSQRAVVWACALLLGAFASAVLAYHQFGTLCCERHATLRQGMVLLALANFAGLLGGTLLLPRRIVLAALLLALLTIRSGALLADWQALPQVIAVRNSNWASGTGPGDAMTLRVMPPGQITNSDALPVGQYRRTTDAPFGDTPWFAWGIMARFGKHALTIAPADR